MGQPVELMNMLVHAEKIHTKDRTLTKLFEYLQYIQYLLYFSINVF